MAGPWPTAGVLSIGDSWGDQSPVDWPLRFIDYHPTIPILRRAVTARCLWWTGGVNGASTVQSNIAADLAAAPNADYVVCTTTAGNDILSRKYGQLTALTLADLQGAANDVMNQIVAAKKIPIMMCCFWTRAMVNGIAQGTLADAQAAWDVREAFNPWLRTAVESRNGIFYDPSWLWIIKGYNNLDADNGIKPEYTNDLIHPNDLATKYMAQDIMAMIRAKNWRRAAA